VEEVAMMKTFWLAVLVAAALAVLPGVASAQKYRPQSKFNNGTGIWRPPVTNNTLTPNQNNWTRQGTFWFPGQGSGSYKAPKKSPGMTPWNATWVQF